MSRLVRACYQDPADLVWLHAAAALGWTVQRSADVYASWDGRRTLTLASAEYLDADDCLAQMIFHEICHLLVSGEAALSQVDWGLDNTSARDLVFEHATNRLQAALAQAYGLRHFMAVTTVWRSYYDALPHDPLAMGDDPAIAAAREGWQRAAQPPYRAILDAALGATAALAALLRPHAPPDSLWSFAQERHPVGTNAHADTTLRCSSCAWAIVQRHDKLECRLTRPGCRPASYSLAEAGSDTPPAARLDATQSACEYHEAPLSVQDCFQCGACCHRGFDVVELAAGERFAKQHPELVERRSSERYVVPRPNGHCVALQGDGSAAASYLCRHYADRPRSCRDFELGGDACLLARQRCGLPSRA
ncbi:MAG TPA: YkgJ family cysteine cluster protein [Pseudomonadaceae bacterium]|nr:YkgJ family cysteine cluster protein [Pseudomonadaceae bacterium]